MKDAKGHGSNAGTAGMRLIKSHTNGAHVAKVYNNPEWEEKVVKYFNNGQYQGAKADYHTQDADDAHATAQNQLRRYSDADAKKDLAHGNPKAQDVPVHDGAVGRFDYNPVSVNKAIASSNRSGRKIGGKEAKAIHALLRGR